MKIEEREKLIEQHKKNRESDIQTDQEATVEKVYTKYDERMG